MNIITDISRLRINCRPVERFDSVLAATAQEMLETMRKHGGVGLAAIQVGIDLQLFVADIEGGRVFVNPKFIRYSTFSSEGLEGCLSIPDKIVNVYRANVIKLVFKDCKGWSHYCRFDNRNARIIQHEMDHLRGVLITDYKERL